MPEHRPVIDRLNLRSLSSVTALERVRIGEVISDDDAAKLIADRRDLLLWLLSGVRAEGRQRVSEALRSLEIFRSDFIQVRSVFSLTDPPVISSPKSEKVLFEGRTSCLYLHLDLGVSFWVPAFRAIFSTLLPGEDSVDVRQCALNARLILTAASEAEAREELEQAGFHGPVDHANGAGQFGDNDLWKIADEDGTAGAGTSERLTADGTAGDADGAEISDATESSGSQLEGPQAALSEPQGPHHDGRASSVPGSREPGHPGSGTHNHSERGNERGLGGTPSGDSSARPGNQRTEWMRSYVMPGNKRTTLANIGDGQRERDAAVEATAVNTVVDYEETRNFIVERMPHHNPGYDFIFRSKKTGDKRLIEVKGLYGEWNDRGVKLTRTEIMNAQEYGDEYWLYVVERALDPTTRKMHAIKNPFFKASEFWFDYVWREIADEHGGDLRSRFVPGRRVKVKEWGIGTVVKIEHRGIASKITIDFQIHGTRQLNFNLTTMELIEE